ncbi:heavy-metal-associated domain-containing protein [Lutibacter sp.]|uniref:heavy-metal-associated domain-containing protein n=1 Tax=Lutibacter sp. TaxID=1925666 RepID=UPI00273547D1|nr:heavy-metal-associated domain-containing protein [Lutibacter sp.]MDP3312861.1 heavy-metal-associated domain-containing protein [Lutibacter sp.]
MSRLFFYAFVIILFTHCTNGASNKDSLKDNSKNKELAVSLKSFEAEISGMTCEIGCARLIESKVSKIKGIIKVKVNFEAKKGSFTFNENVVSEAEIIRKINEIAGGNLYRVEKIEQLD